MFRNVWAHLSPASAVGPWCGVTPSPWPCPVAAPPPRPPNRTRQKTRQVTRQHSSLVSPLVIDRRHSHSFFINRSRLPIIYRNRYGLFPTLSLSHHIVCLRYFLRLPLPSPAAAGSPRASAATCAAPTVSRRPTAGAPRGTCAGGPPVKRGRRCGDFGRQG
jgi:hypothetical protein